MAFAWEQVRGDGRFRPGGASELEILGLGPGDPLAGQFEVAGVDFAADEGAIVLPGGDAGGPGAHEGVADDLSFV